MESITLEEALKVYEEQPNEVKQDDIKPLSFEEAQKAVTNNGE